MMMRISFDIETQDDVVSALNRLYALLGKESPVEVNVVRKVPDTVEVPTMADWADELADAEKVEVPAAATPPTVRRKDLGEYLRNLALKYGEPAQQKMGEVTLEKAGTQALSQVPEETLPLIMDAMRQWEAENS